MMMMGGSCLHTRKISACGVRRALSPARTWMVSGVMKGAKAEKDGGAAHVSSGKEGRAAGPGYRGPRMQPGGGAKGSHAQRRRQEKGRGRCADGRKESCGAAQRRGRLRWRIG